MRGGANADARYALPGLSLRKSSRQRWKDLVGCGVSPHPELISLVDELGCQRLLIRCSVQEGPEQDRRA